jgi:hypothetical protein
MTTFVSNTPMLGHRSLVPKDIQPVHRPSTYSKFNDIFWYFNPPERRHALGIFIMKSAIPMIIP